MQIYFFISFILYVINFTIGHIKHADPLATIKRSQLYHIIFSWCIAISNCLSYYK